MRIVIVGGAGYIGSTLTRELLNHNHTVLVVDNLLLGDGGIADIHHPNFRFIEGDSRTPDPFWFIGGQAADHLRPVDCVINLSGFSNDPTAEFRPDVNWELNVTSAAKIADSAKIARVPRLIFASSASLYHSAKSQFDVEVTEEYPVKPEWHYATSKYAGELACMAFHVPGEFDVVALRKGTVCGPSHRMRYDLMLNTMFRAAVTNGAIQLHGGAWMYRPLVGVNDAARAYRMIVEAPLEKVSGQIFNVVGENSTVRDYAERMKAVLDVVVLETLPMFGPVRLEETPAPKVVRSYRVSSRKLREQLGWVPTESVETITDDLICAYKDRNIKPVKRLGVRPRNNRLGIVLPDFDDPTCDNIKMIRERYETKSVLVSGEV